MTQKSILILIPGIGDRSRAYEVFAFVWRLLGYEVHIVAFGWTDRASRLAPKDAAFLKQIEALGKGRELSVIGISAGGTAAVNALAARPKLVHKVIAVCSPLSRFKTLDNPLLAESIEEAQANLDRVEADTKQRILSVYALYDQVVNVALSRAEGVKTLRLWSVLHAPTIFVALTLGAPRLRRFLTAQ
jgi:pimeloyl-ACP methyl ester carboxylesterase